jgi:hypothetical protein
MYSIIIEARIRVLIIISTRILVLFQKSPVNAMMSNVSVFDVLSSCLTNSNHCHEICSNLIVGSLTKLIL